MKEASIRDIVLAGGVGGFAYWALTLLRGGQPAGEYAQFDRGTWLWISLGLTIAVGAVASFVMVYFVAVTNTKDRMRAAGFAVMCGLCWEPVLTGAIGKFTQQYGDKQAEQHIAEAQHLAVGPATPPLSAAKVAADLVESTPAVQNPVLKEQVEGQTQHLLQAIENTPSVAEKSDALQQVGLAAARAGDPVVLARTVKSLETIAIAEPTHAKRALDAVTAINQAAATR